MLCYLLSGWEGSFRNGVLVIIRKYNSRRKIMENEQEFEKKLTQEEIEVEINKIGDFFKQIPEELKAVAAEHFIYEIVAWASRDHYQALGIFFEALSKYRKISNRILLEEAEDERLLVAYRAARDYRCLERIESDPPILVDEVCKIGYIGEDDSYSGGKRYEVFLDSGEHFDICQHSLEIHFELVEDVDEL